jgi:hypothetical protein
VADKSQLIQAEARLDEKIKSLIGDMALVF